ncbi:hypothetical protein V6R21_14775 [Limibacter armeniacum]|uniref:hypothetical protein n=1 Tax=Limibacter armeniacum TaxID=466084 RepID=UPI002FE55D6E
MKRNFLTEQYSTKSDQELKVIIESADYTDDAKLAAKWILNERGESVNYKAPKKKIKKSEVMTFGKHLSPKQKRTGQQKILIIGLINIGIALFLGFDILFTTNNSLTSISGTIRNTEVDAELVTSKGTLGHEARSHKATLSFSLNEYPKLFILSKNIGGDYSYPLYYQISRSLKNSSSVTVWVKKSDLEQVSPKVYQIAANGEVLLAFDYIKYEKLTVILFLFLIGIVCLTLTYFLRNKP